MISMSTFRYCRFARYMYMHIAWVLQLSHMQISLYSSLLDSWFMGVEWGHNEGIILNYHIWIYTHMYGKLIFYSLTIMLQLYICIIFYISMQESWKSADSRLAWYPSLSSTVYLDHSIYAIWGILNKKNHTC